MKNNTPILIGAIAIFVLVLGAGIYAYVKSNDEVVPAGVTGTGANAPVAMKFFGIERPNFVVRGENLGRVEIWATVSGQEKMLGTAILQVGTQPQGGNSWTLPIPPRIGATAIYARGYDRAGKPAARMDLAPADIKGL
jgi:hypothetical protein